MVGNKGLVYKAIPEGIPVVGRHIVVEQSGFDLNTEPPPHGITVKSLFASFDPFLLGRMRRPDIPWAYTANEIDQPIDTYSLAQVLRTNNKNFREGDTVRGLMPLQEYCIVAGVLVEGLETIKLHDGIDPKTYLGILGMPGLTAYSSFYGIGKPKKGEAIFISSAAGAVGQLVGQLAKHEGLKVYGSVGSQEKLDHIVNDLGFDGGFNYKLEPAGKALRGLVSDGLDIYYDNVGGEQLEAALALLRDFGRIVVSGMMSQYGKSNEEIYKVKNLMNIVTARLTIQGFVWKDPNMGPKYAAEHREILEKWLLDGTFKTTTETTEGMENAAKGLVRMLEGSNFGKAILVV